MRLLDGLRRRPTTQVPALDALRSLAILLVVVGHASAENTRLAGASNAFASLFFVRGGFVGVDLFFVLSGYLIGRELWLEVERTGGIAVGRFMLRRSFRIWPLYFFFFFFVIVVLGRADFANGKWWSDAVFLTNYVNRGVVMGSWSLCTEEQFYVVAPVVLWLTMRPGRRVASYRPWLLGLLVALPLLRALTWLHFVGSFAAHDQLTWKRIYYQFHTHADGLVMGLLVSNLAVAARGSEPRGVFRTPWIFALAACIGIKQLHPEVLSFTATALFFGLVLHFVVRRRASGLSLPVLDSKAFYVVSRLSFGMYLNHEYLTGPIAAATRALLPFAARLPALHGFISALLVALASTAVSVVTYALVEAPFMRLRERVLGARSTRQAAAPELLAPSGVPPVIDLVAPAVVLETALPDSGPVVLVEPVTAVPSALAVAEATRRSAPCSG